MQQYKAYLEETFPGESCYIDPQGRGWASYKIQEHECYIVHCFIAPEFRKDFKMSELCANIEEIAKKSGCLYMTGTADIRSTCPERSVRMMLSDGYTLHSAHDNIITLIKYL